MTGNHGRSWEGWSELKKKRTAAQPATGPQALNVTVARSSRIPLSFSGFGSAANLILALPRFKKSQRLRDVRAMEETKRIDLLSLTPDELGEVPGELSRPTGPGR